MLPASFAKHRKLFYIFRIFLIVSTVKLSDTRKDVKKYVRILLLYECRRSTQISATDDPKNKCIIAL